MPPSPQPPTAESAADALARLQVLPADAQRLNPAQQKFNRLLSRVNHLERLVDTLQQRADQLRAPHLQRMAELQRRAQRAQQATALFLHARLERGGLPPAQQRAARALLRGLLQAAPPPEDEAQRRQWQQLQARYLPPPPGPDVLAQQMQGLMQQFQEMTGQQPDLTGLDQLQTPEQLLQAILRRQQQEQEASAERRAERRARRAPTARQAQAQAEQQDARTALRSIYRQLASALHPDRATDPAERGRKHALMSQANTAYERGNLLALLRLQMAAEQVDAAAIAALSDERLASLSLLLQCQVGVLDRALAETGARLSHELGVDVDARGGPDALARQLQAQQLQAQEEANTLEADLQRMQDDAALKRWLREQADPARGQARAGAQSSGFNPLR